MITTALYSVMTTAPRWYVVTQTPFQSTGRYITTQQGAAMVQCMRTAEQPGAGHFQTTFWGRAPNLARSDLQGNQDPGKPCMHGNGRRSLASLRAA